MISRYVLLHCCTQCAHSVHTARYSLDILPNSESCIRRDFMLDFVKLVAPLRALLAEMITVLRYSSAGERCYNQTTTAVVVSLPLGASPHRETDYRMFNRTRVPGAQANTILMERDCFVRFLFFYLVNVNEFLTAV